MLLALLAAIIAQAAEPYPKADFERREKVLKEVDEAFAYAEAELPPCEAHEHMSNVALRYAPPVSCPKATKFHEYILRIDRRIRENCREVSRWMEAELRDPLLCEVSGRAESNRKKIREYKRNMTQGFADDENSTDAFLDQDPEKPIGEMKNVDCALPVIIGMQFRKKQLSMANRHYGLAEIVLDSVCDENGAEAKDEYLNFLRRGERGFSDAKPNP